MTPHLTIAYITTRKDNGIAWFLVSLINQLKELNETCHVIVVDFNTLGVGPMQVPFALPRIDNLTLT